MLTTPIELCTSPLFVLPLLVKIARDLTPVPTIDDTLHRITTRYYTELLSIKVASVQKLKVLKYYSFMHKLVTQVMGETLLKATNSISKDQLP